MVYKNVAPNLPRKGKTSVENIQQKLSPNYIESLPRPGLGQARDREPWLAVEDGRSVASCLSYGPGIFCTIVGSFCGRTLNRCCTVIAPLGLLPPSVLLCSGMEGAVCRLLPHHHQNSSSSNTINIIASAVCSWPPTTDYSCNPDSPASPATPLFHTRLLQHRSRCQWMVG